MKNTLLILMLIPVITFAQSFLISDIPLPKTYIQNLDPYPCDEECMQEYIDNDMIFSFLAHANHKLESEELNDVKTMNVSILNLGSFSTDIKFKIAMLLPYKKIGKYATSTTNSALSYLITRNSSFELKSYKVNSEEFNELNTTLNQIKKDGFKYVIATVTKKGADNISDINSTLNIYFPTINKKDSNTTSKLLYYGAIDYEAQSDLLIKESVSPLVIFYDNSSIGTKLANYEEETFKNRILDNNNFENMYMSVEEAKVFKFSIPRKTTNLEKQLKENEDIQNGSFFINTPIVKTSMIMSQITLYDSNATNVLSTQINYNPLILSMTQYDDRKNMIIANSITKKNNVLIEINSLLNNDIMYDWINYATTIGVDYFFNKLTNNERIYNIPLTNNQMQYDIELISPSLSKFSKYKTKSEH